MAWILTTYNHHHHHRGGSAAVSGTEQCPIGHMLAAAIAVDVGVPAPIEPDGRDVIDVQLPALRRPPAAAYRSRAPPA